MNGYLLFISSLVHLSRIKNLLPSENEIHYLKIKKNVINMKETVSCNNCGIWQTTNLDPHKQMSTVTTFNKKKIYYVLTKQAYKRIKQAPWIYQVIGMTIQNLWIFRHRLCNYDKENSKRHEIVFHIVSLGVCKVINFRYSHWKMFPQKCYA